MDLFFQRQTRQNTISQLASPMKDSQVIRRDQRCSPFPDPYRSQERSTRSYPPPPCLIYFDGGQTKSGNLHRTKAKLNLPVQLLHPWRTSNLTLPSLSPIRMRKRALSSWQCSRTSSVGFSCVYVLPAHKTHDTYLIFLNLLNSSPKCIMVDSATPSPKCSPLTLLTGTTIISEGKRPNEGIRHKHLRSIYPNLHRKRLDLSTHAAGLPSCGPGGLHYRTAPRTHSTSTWMTPSPAFRPPGSSLQGVTDAQTFTPALFSPASRQPGSSGLELPGAIQFR